MQTSHRLFTLGLLLLSAGCNRDELAPYAFPSPVAVDCETIPKAYLNVPYSWTPEYDPANSRAPLEWSAEGLPPGLSIDKDTGEVSGTPTMEGTFNPIIIVKDSSTPAQVARVTCGTLEVTAAGVVCVDDTGSITDGIVGEPYTFTPSVPPGVGAPPFTWDVQGLPPELTFDPATGVITGTPLTAGDFNVTMTATDSTGATFDAECGLLTIWPRLSVDPDKLLEVYPDGCVGPGVTLQDLIDNGVVIGGDGSAIACELRAGNGNGKFPAGITVTADTCQIQGTVSTSERYGMHVWITSMIQGPVTAHVPYCAPQAVQAPTAYGVEKTWMGQVSTLKPGLATMSGSSVTFGDNTPDPRVEVTRSCAGSCFFKYFFAFNTLNMPMVSANPSGKLGMGFDGFFHGLSFTENNIPLDTYNSRGRRHWVVNFDFDYCISNVEADCATQPLAVQNGEGSNYALGVIVRPE